MSIYLKLLIVLVCVALFTTIANVCFGQNYTKEGDKFIQTEKAETSKNDALTTFTWKDKSGNEYPLYIHKYTKGENAGKYTCYIIKVSSKTGKEYKYYLPSGMMIAEDIIQRKPEYAI